MLQGGRRLAGHGLQWPAYLEEERKLPLSVVHPWLLSFLLRLLTFAQPRNRVRSGY